MNRKDKERESRLIGHGKFAKITSCDLQDAGRQQQSGISLSGQTSPVMEGTVGVSDSILGIDVANNGTGLETGNGSTSRGTVMTRGAMLDRDQHIPTDIVSSCNRVVVAVHRESERPVAVVGFQHGTDGRDYLEARMGAENIADDAGHGPSQIRSITTRLPLCDDCGIDRAWSTGHYSYFCPICERDDEKGR